VSPSDAAVEAALRQMQSQSQALQVATPINDVQLVALMATRIYHGNGAPGQAVSLARQILVEAILAEKEESLVSVIDHEFKRRHPSESTPAGSQYLIPGTRP
jgi:hypothetical protein